MDNQPKKKNRFAWLLWWQIEPEELDKQVSQYNDLKFFRSVRGQAVACLAFSIAVTCVLVYSGVMDSSAFIDAGIMAVLAIFIYLGHRWAMILAMVLWTIEKGFAVMDSPGRLVMHVIWWCIYMHAFYFSFRVEQERMKRPAAPAPALNVDPA
jgi:hypothetical protein